MSLISIRAQKTGVRKGLRENQTPVSRRRDVVRTRLQTGSQRPEQNRRRTSGHFLIARTKFLDIHQLEAEMLSTRPWELHRPFCQDRKSGRARFALNPSERGNLNSERGNRCSPLL
jgi:hypothetical protein